MTENGGSKLVRIRRLAVVQKPELAVKYISLVVLVVQNASQVLVMRYVRTRPQEMFLSTVAVFVTEIVKLITCFFLVSIEERSVIRCTKMVYRQIFWQPIDTLKVCVPAIIYVVQNNLLYVAVSNLEAAIYMVTYQLKILTTALFTVIILRRRLSVLQWLALALLFAGVAMVQVDQNNAKIAASKKSLNISDEDLLGNLTSTNTTAPVSRKENSIHGFLAILAACILSGFAGIYFEKILKGSDISVFMRNIQLAIISLPASLASVFIKDSEKVFEKGFLVGFDWQVWGMIMISSLGGLTVAVVIKYADNILKAFATSIAIVLACVAAFFLFNFIPTWLFLVGTALVIAAVFIYSMFPYKKKYQPAPTAPPAAEDDKQATAAV